VKQITRAIEHPGEVLGGRSTGADYGYNGRTYGSRTGAAAEVWVTDEERHELHAREVTNWEGKRVLVFPLFWVRGEPHYPPVHLEPGEKRRAEEKSMNAFYDAYRDEKKKQRGSPAGRREEWG
jgi:hypothetical protein